MNMAVAQQYGCNSRDGSGANIESMWLEQVRELLVRDCGVTRRELEQLDLKLWMGYCANGLSPEEAVMAEYFHG